MKSNFSGNILGLIGINILSILIILVSFGILTPWAVCLVEGWYAKHTVIEGKRLKFIGTGGALFVKYLVWFLLTIITLGIYGFWLQLKMKQWVVENTIFE